MHPFSRTELLIGPAGLKKLSQSTVAVFGIGGVGTFVVEGLARSGVGKFFLVDNDVITMTNINRQIHSTHSTLGRSKVEVMKERILDINPQAEVTAIERFYLPEVGDDIFSSDFDYIVDAVDTVTAKIDLVVRAKAQHIPIICAMGAGNKLDPTRFQVTDLFQTSVCPLAKVMRRELRLRGIESCKVVYSQEEPVPHQQSESSEAQPSGSCQKRIPGSIAFVPSVMGLIIAGEVIKDLLLDKNS